MYSEGKKGSVQVYLQWMHEHRTSRTESVSFLSALQLGLKINGAPKHLLFKDLNFESRKPENTENDPDYVYDENDSEDETKDALSWRGVIELDTILYPTMKGTLDIDERGTIYNIVASMALPDGIAEVRDEFDFIVSEYLLLFIYNCE